MRTFALLSLLVAGVAGAQQATTNCRSSATPCSSAGIITNGNVTVGAVTANIIARDFTGASGFGVWIDRQVTVNRGICLAGSVVSGVCLNAITVDGTTAATFSSSIVGTFNITSGTASGNIAFSSLTGAWWDLGGGSNDRFKSDGTNVLVDTNFAAVTDATSTLGTTSSAWLRGYFTAGAVLNQNTVVKWTTPPISDNTEATSQVLFNDLSQEPAYATSSRKYNPLGQAKEWVVEKRWLGADIGIENANCPLASTGLKGTGAAAVTFSCTDAAAAGQSTLSGETYRIENTTTTINTVSIVDLSANVTELQFGPKVLQRVSIPSGSTANVRIWVALVPTATSLSGVDTGAISVVGFRFSTAVPDTNWQACSGDGASVACTNTSTAPTTGTNLLLEIDCREASTCRFLINGSLVATRSATLPGSTAQLAPRVLVQTLNTTAKALWYGRSSLQTN